MWGIDVPVPKCNNKARIDNFMNLINLNFYVREKFPK